MGYTVYGIRLEESQVNHSFGGAGGIAIVPQLVACVIFTVNQNFFSTLGFTLKRGDGAALTICEGKRSLKIALKAVLKVVDLVAPSGVE